jgi:hypothetical protein
LDISNPDNPVLIANYPMLSPHGLGVLGNMLFICEGDAGLRLFDISDENDIHLLAHITDIHAYDVIVRTGNAIVTGEDGIFQYTFSEQGALTQISKIPVNRAEL